MQATLNLTHHLIRGEIDNRTQGEVRGILYVEGLNTPLQLKLEGDCWRDLAGCQLEFINREQALPLPSKLALSSVISGCVGDMTASSRRVTLNANGEPESWQNSFSLEFFDENAQRYLIESSTCELRASAPEWIMDGDTEAAQRMSNQQAMRNYVRSRLSQSNSEELSISDHDDEYAWEARLQYSDRMNILYDEVMEKYADDEDSETKEAFAMGWDHLLGALADESESSPSTPDFPALSSHIGEDFDSIDFDLLDDSILDEAFDEEQHPLYKQAVRLLTEHPEFWQEAKKSGKELSARLFSPLLQVSGQLASALHDDTPTHNPGYCLAILKRCTNWLQEVLSTLDQLPPSFHTRSRSQIRQKLFELRQGILELRTQLKGSSPD